MGLKDWLRRSDDSLSGLSERLAILQGRVAALELEQEAFRNKILRKYQAATKTPSEPPKAGSPLKRT